MTVHHRSTLGKATEPRAVLSLEASIAARHRASGKLVK